MIPSQKLTDVYKRQVIKLISQCVISSHIGTNLNAKVDRWYSVCILANSLIVYAVTYGWLHFNFSMFLDTAKTTYSNHWLTESVRLLNEILSIQITELRYQYVFSDLL